MRELAGSRELQPIILLCPFFRSVAREMVSDAKQSALAGHWVVYFADTGARVFPVPELTFPAPEPFTNLKPSSIVTNSDGSTLFLWLPHATLNIEHREMWIWENNNAIFPTSWNLDLGIPFVFDVFWSTVTSSSDE